MRRPNIKIVKITKKLNREFIILLLFCGFVFIKRDGEYFGIIFIEKPFVINGINI